MTSKQFTMMGEFIAKSYNIDEIKTFNQVTLGSILYRKWVKQKDKIFYITVVGQSAYYAYGSENILRKNYASALSKYIKGQQENVYARTSSKSSIRLVS